MHHRTRPEWTIILTVPKPRPLSPRWRALLRAGLFSLSLGLNLGVGAALAHGAPAASGADACEDYAALHYEMSGGLDSAYEDAFAACSAREGSFAQAAYWADQCQSETSWALYLPESDTWRAECGDADGNHVGAP